MLTPRAGCLLGRWPGLKGGKPARRRISGLSGYALPEAVRVGTARGVAGARAASSRRREPRPQGEGEGGAAQGGAGALDSTPLAPRRPTGAWGGGGSCGEGAWPRPCGQGLPRSRPPRASRQARNPRREGRGRGRGETVGHRGGASSQVAPPLASRPRPRPSRRLPGDRRGAGVCAGADLCTVGGGGLGQRRVSAARRGGDCGRRGQVRPPRGAGVSRVAWSPIRAAPRGS